MRNFHYGDVDYAAGMGDVKWKTAVVTGASRGIRRAIAEKLAAEEPLLSSITMVQRGGRNRLAGIRAAGGDGCVMQCNVSILRRVKRG